MPSISRAWALALVAVVLGLLVLVGRVLAPRGQAPGARGDAAGETAAGAASAGDAALLVESAAPDPREQLVVVHVVGAVRRPGLVRLDRGARVAEAIRAAGGTTRRAALELVNLAAPLADGQQVAVPERIGPGGTTSGSAAVAAGAPAGPVNLNAATIEQLDTLPGIGPVTAQKIVDYRDAHGPFGSVDELDQIPGIGPARVEQLRELVVV